ncbi:MAG: PAS domain S-box protein [Geobacteraceae bacterium]
MSEVTSDSGMLDEKLCSTLVHSINGIVWEADPLTFRFSFVSPHAERILGYPMQQWLDEPDFWRTHTHPDDVEWCSDYCREASFKGEDHEFQYRMIAADNRIVWLHDIVTVVRLADGAIQLRGIMFDITERKKAEDTLRANEERLRVIFDTSHSGILMIDPDGNISFANKRMAEMFSCTLPELIGSPYLDRLPPDELQTNINLLEQLMNREIDNGSTERHYLRCDGSDFWGYVTSTRLKLASGEPKALIAVVTDITDRKTQQLALLEETAHWHMMMEHSRDGIVILNEASSAVRDVNPAFAEMLGYKRNEMLGMHPWDWDLRFTREEIEAMPAGHIAGDIFFETRMRRKDGTTRDVEVSSTLTEFSGERQFFCICRDITERNRVEDEIRKDKALLRCIIDSVGDLIFIKDVNGVYQACNKAAEEFIGLLESEQIGKTDFDFFDRDVAEVIQKSDQQILASGKESRFEEWLTYKDGRKGLLDTVKAPYYGPDGKQLGLVGIARDITDRKHAEELIRQERELCLDLVNHQPAGIYRIRVSPREKWRKNAWNSSEHTPYSVELVNDRFCGILGISRQDIETNPGIVIDLVHPEDKAEFARKNEEAAAKLIPFQWEGRLNVGGKIPWAHFESLPRPLANGDVLWSGILYDITEKKQGEADKEELEAQNRQLQKSESLGRMAAAIAHYFNNQFEVVIGNLEMAIYELPQGAGPVDRLTAAMQATEKAAEMSGMMLTYLGQSSGKREPLDLSEVCSQALSKLRAVMPKKVILETDLASPGPVISANANKIQQLLTNLATNAWETVGEKRGAIHLNVKIVSPSEIPASHRFPIGWQPQDNVYACLEVADTGCGIADNDIEKLFDPFFSSKFAGRGLGLPVVLGIVKAHGGAVTVESEPGQGSKFRVFLPVSAEEISRQPDKTPQPLAMEGGGTVLLVEDDSLVRDIAATMIKHLGFYVIEAKDGVDAVEVFRQRRNEISCVLCDLTMPRMNGWETLTALRKLAPGIPVILASGYDEAQVMEGDHPELPQVFLGKPYKHKGLSDAINQALVSMEK